MNNKTLRKFTLLFALFSTITAALPVVGFSQTVGAAAVSANPYAEALAVIEQKTEARRQELGIPGMSLVIVKDDQIIFMKGLGYKDFEKKVAVTPDTQFAIGSATKAFTALSVLMAQDAGKLSLDDNPKKYLPYFKMQDPETDKNITIRDLLSHSSGLNRTDLAMVTGKLNRAELIQVAAQAKPTAKLREKWQYQNLMFAAAGEIVATVEKKPWEKLVPKRILKPLGMKNTTMSIADMQKAKDRSLGYTYNFDTKETTLRPYREIQQVAPAGSINSSARDMATWVRFVLNRGEVNGKRLVSEQSFDEWVKPQMKMTPDGKRSYGLGWFLDDWKGNKVVQHAGNIDGFNALVAMIPEKKLGFVMLTNVSASPMGQFLMPLVWQNILEGAEKPKVEETVKTRAIPIGSAVGKYTIENANVEMEVKAQDGKLVLVVPGQPGYTLENESGNRYRLSGAPAGFFITFKENGAYLEQPHGNFNLVRAGGEATARPPVNSGGAKELVGTYSTPSGTGTVEVKDADGKVTFNIPGQPPYELKDKAKDQFFLNGLPESYWLRTKRDEAGKLIALVITQPEGEFEFKRKEQAETEKPKISIDELMQKAVDAVGGEANWRKFSTRVMEMDIDLENQGVKATATTWAKAPNKTASETTMTAVGKTIAKGWDYFDGSAGEEAYSFVPVTRYTGKRLEDVRAGADFFGPINWKSYFRKAEVKGMGKVGEEEAYIVSFESEKGTNVTEYYSIKSFLLLKREGFIASGTSQNQLPYSVTYSDYRDVDGIKLPFRTVNYSPSNGNIITMVRSVKHDVPVEDAIFSPRVVELK